MKTRRFLLALALALALGLPMTGTAQNAAQPPAAGNAAPAVPENTPAAPRRTPAAPAGTPRAPRAEANPATGNGRNPAAAPGQAPSAAANGATVTNPPVPSNGRNGSAKPQTATVEGNVRITLSAVPMQAVVLYISEFAGKPVLLPERFPGDRTVDVVSGGASDVTQAKAIEILSTALRNVGYMMIEHPDYIQIISEGDAGAPVRSTFPESGFAAQTLLTIVVDVKNADAAKLQPILSGLKSKGGNIQVYPDSNKLILTEQGSQMRVMLDLIHSLDTKWADNTTEVVRLEKSSVEGLGGVASAYVKNLSDNAEPLIAKRLKGFSVYAHMPTNSFVLFGNPEDIARVKLFIKSLDVAADVAARSYHTYFVLNRDAADLVNVLNSVFAAVKARSPQNSTEPIPTVVPDQVNGAIIVIAAPDKYQEILPLIQQLDKPKAQVLIESALIEMSTDKLLDLGLELATLDPPGSSMRGFGVTSFGLSTLTPEGRVPIVPPDGGLTAGLFKNQALNIAALLRMSQKDGNISFIAAPRLMASDNKPAEVTISEKREYDKSFISPEGNTSGVSGGQFNEAKITLKITPHINEEGTVRLEIEQITEQFLPASEGANGQPLQNITSRTAKTEVLVPEGTTVVIAGLTRTVQSKTINRVPLVGSIPLVGYLFRRTTTTNEQRNLCVFITPTILRGAAALAAETQFRKEEMTKAAKKGGIPLPDGTFQDILVPPSSVKVTLPNGK